MYSISLKNLEYRLRRFRDSLPLYLEEAISEKEDVIVSAVQNQLYRRGITGRGIKIMSYMPYALSTIKAKKKKGQPTTRVTLRDTGKFYAGMHVVFDSKGFYVTSSDSKTNKLIGKYGIDILRLTDENINRILRVHIRNYLERKVRQAIRK